MLITLLNKASDIKKAAVQQRLSLSEYKEELEN
jgi:hypothetical protein